MVTYENQSPSEIRTGDVVTTSDGRAFVAFSDAVMDMGDFQVLGVTLTGEKKYFTIEPDSLVTISYDESMWNEDNYN